MILRHIYNLLFIQSRLQSDQKPIKQYMLLTFERCVQNTIQDTVVQRYEMSKSVPYLHILNMKYIKHMLTQQQKFWRSKFKLLLGSTSVSNTSWYLCICIVCDLFVLQIIIIMVYLFVYCFQNMYIVCTIFITI